MLIIPFFLDLIGLEDSWQAWGKVFANPTLFGIFERISCNTGTPFSFLADLQLTGNKEALIINYHQNPENINILKTCNGVVLYQNYVVIVQSNVC